MNLLRFRTGQEKLICDEIRAWSAYALKKDIGDLPACPYAKACWDSERIEVVFKKAKDKLPLYIVLSQFDDAYDVVVVVDLAYEPADEFHENVNTLNENIAEGMFIQKDLWLMGFHPDDDAVGSIDNGTFKGVNDVRYAMYFVQRLSKLQEASDKLKPLGYYQKYFDDDADLQQAFKLRESFYRKLEYGR